MHSTLTDLAAADLDLVIGGAARVSTDAHVVPSLGRAHPARPTIGACHGGSSGSLSDSVLGHMIGATCTSTGDAHITSGVLAHITGSDAARQPVAHVVHEAEFDSKIANHSV
jgi:hypothetical protein